MFDLPEALPPRSRDFLSLLEERVVFFDGAMGTNIQRVPLTPQDFEGLEGCNEILVLTRPDVIRSIHASFLAVGSDIVETNTFGANGVVLGEYGLADQVYALNRAAALLAREVAEEFSTPERPRFVAGSIGPGTKLPSLGQISFDALRQTYREQALGLMDGGADVLLIETCQDLLQTKAAIVGVSEAFLERGWRLPLMVQVTIETSGTMLLGTEIGAALTAVEAYEQVLSFGMNCATGPEPMTEHIAYLSRNCSRFISVQPNAGLPQVREGQTHYPLGPQELARALKMFVEEFGVNLVGGCCGTRPEHLQAVVEAIGFRPPRRRNPEWVPSVSSLYLSVPLRQDPPPLIVGERANANGSRRFRELLLADDYDGLVGIARSQEREGAHVLDVCVAYVGRDEVKDMEATIRRFATQVTLPLMIDSTEPPAIEAALKWLGGKSIINSINLEEGEERMQRILALARRYGAAVVALTIDEQGMAKTAQRKFAIAQRIYQLATEKYGIKPWDLLFDPLTFTLGSGDEEFRRAGIETLEALRLIKENLPHAHTLLGVSNISFGLKPAARVVLNSVFLHYAIEYGLDAAIVNAERILPLYRIEEPARELARQLIFDERRPGFDPLVEFMALFEEAKAPAPRRPREELPLEERLKRHIIDGEKEGLIPTLEEALQRYEPLRIINEFLLEGMKVVGDLFASGEMQLPFVLQSAEVMKAAVAYLERFMEKATDQVKGSIVLATVKGDVHDIGKNLVDIILSNNGYRVYNLGIKQPIENIIQAALEHRADAIGMSGLLVKSTLVMKENLEELNRRGLWHFPVLLGGAALTRRYVEEELRPLYKGQVFYAEDAFEGLRLMEQLTGHALPPPSPPRPARPRRSRPALAQAAAVPPSPARAVPPAPDIPRPPFYGSRVVRELNLWEIYPYINEVALFRGQWQFRRGRRPRQEYERFLEEEVRPLFEEWKRRAAEEGLLVPQVVYGYFPAQSEGNDLIVYRDPEGRQEWLRFTFPRRRKPPYLCLADYFEPKGSERVDVLAVQLVTMGPRASEFSRHLFESHQYRDYLLFHGLSVEATEGLAEYWHKRIREELGIAHQDSPNIRDLFKLGYRGARYSFGYPACPNLEDQAKLFLLLEPERIGVSLTEEYQLVPEQSTSALIVHHPQARYFSVE